MDVEIITVIMASAIIVMLYCLWLVFSLKSRVPGGVVGKRWRVLTAMVVLFSIGYAAMPFLGELSEVTLRYVVALIFFFGAIYVAITIKLIHTVIEELSA
ncbi:MAG: hypothetical protein K6T56_09550 [Burkholderiales bacterium]|jgi:hypothetical protein|nr:hypothetical protein [Burkholderiales bacterium]